MPPLRYLLFVLLTLLPTAAIAQTAVKPPTSTAETPKHYKTRPSLDLRFGIPGGHQFTCQISYDSELCRFPWYQDFVLPPIYSRWKEGSTRFVVGQEPPATTSVTFLFHADGSITLKRVIRGDSSVVSLLINCVTQSAPFLNWSDDMIEVIGKEQPITFTVSIH